MIWLAILLVLALLQPVLTTDKPWFCKKEYDSEGVADQAIDHCVSIWRAPIPFYPNEIRLSERLQPPGIKTKEDHSRTHYLGTDNLGRDVAAGLLKGLRQALWIGLGSMVLCILVGFILGGLGAWYGDLSIKWSSAGMVLRMLSLLYLLVCSTYNVYLTSTAALSGNLIAFLWLLALVPPLVVWRAVRYFENIMPINRLTWTFALDNLLNRFVEFFQSLPALLLLLVMTAVIGKHSAGSLLLVLFLIRWPLATRFIRAEVLTLKEKAYLQYSRQTGISFWKILFREILPNAYLVLIALFAFGVSTAIMLEATLTFLGLGLPLEQVSWGALILHGRQHPQAWWLLVFPGLMILFTLLALLIIGEEIQYRVGPKGKRIRFY